MDPQQYINPKNVSFRDDVAAWKASPTSQVSYPENSLYITKQTEQAVNVINGSFKWKRYQKIAATYHANYMADVNSDVAEVNATWSAWLTLNRLPIRTCVEAKLQGGAFFEITVTTAVPDLAR